MLCFVYRCLNIVSLIIVVLAVGWCVTCDVCWLFCVVCFLSVLCLVIVVCV